MKKTLALILALCMILTASFALAANVTDVADRANDATLASAYNAIMAADHFSEVLGIADAYDLVITQLFGVAAEGENIEFTVEGVVSKVAYTADGAAWTVLEVAADGKVILPKAGVVAVLAQRVVTVATTEPVMYDETICPAFTPSVTGKPAPAMVGAPAGVSNPGDLVVTAVSERALTNDVTTREHLQWAFTNILNNEMQLTADTNGLVVRDLFEVTAYGAAVEATANGVAITFEAGLFAGDTLLVAYSADSATWEVLAAENVVINNDGTVTLNLPKLGAVAFLVEAPDDLPNADQAVSSPE